MESLFEFGLQATRWLQEQYPGLEALLVAVSALGRFEAYLAILPLVYWSFSKSFGRSLVYVAALGQLATTLAKQAFRGPRPFWLEPALGLSEESSYGVPSGHASTAMIVYGYTALRARRGLVWLLAIVMVALMSLSRVYLGVHMPHDVVAGLLLGGAVLLTFWLWERYAGERFHKSILGRRLLLVFLVPLVLGLLFVALRLVLGPPDETLAWAANLIPADAVSADDAVQAVGILLGLGWGFAMEASRVRFQVAGSWWKRLLRYLVGMLGILAIWRGLGAILPSDPLWLGMPLRLARYTLLGLWGAFYAPWVFVRLHLADADPPIAINLTIRPLDKVQS